MFLYYFVVSMAVGMVSLGILCLMTMFIAKRFFQ